MNESYATRDQKDRSKKTNIAKAFRPDAVVTALYIHNRMTCSGIPQNLTAFEIFAGNKLDVGHLRVFKSSCWY